MYESRQGALGSLDLLGRRSSRSHRGVGRPQIDLTRQDFDAVLPNVGDEYVETVVLLPLLRFESVWIQFVIHNDTILMVCSFLCSRNFHKPLSSKEIL
jgi:hypothetical protein